MKKLIIVNLLLSAMAFNNLDAKPKGDFYELRVYHLKNNEQVAQVDNYLSHALIPFFHKNGVDKIGVFKPVGTDTATEKSVYVLIPFPSIEKFQKITDALSSDKEYLKSAKDFTHAPADKAPFERMETILMEAFSGQPNMVVPLKQQGRIYELRSYESPTANLHDKKVAMFNTGGEIPLFNRLGFNPVFYGRVIAGGRMPNFMYMPIFNSVEERSQQWKKFGDDPVWKDISTRPENENKVSVNHIDSIVMQATDYSDI